MASIENNRDQIDIFTKKLGKMLCSLPLCLSFFFFFLGGLKMEILYKIYKKEECMGIILHTSGLHPQYLFKNLSIKGQVSQ